MSKAKRRATTVPVAKPLPDEEALIGECIQYLQAIASAGAAYEGDPDGNNVRAEKIVDRHYRRAGKALAEISALPSTSFSGIHAKSRIVKTLLKDRDDIPEACAYFFASFAADVDRYMTEIQDAERSYAGGLKQPDSVNPLRSLNSWAKTCAQAKNPATKAMLALKVAGETLKLTDKWIRLGGLEA